MHCCFFPWQFKAFLRSLKYLTVKRRRSLSYFMWKCQVRLPALDRKVVLTQAPVLIVCYLIRGSSPPQATTSYKTVWPTTLFFLFHEKMCHSLGLLVSRHRYKTPICVSTEISFSDIRKFDAVSHIKYHRGCLLQMFCSFRTEVSRAIQLLEIIMNNVLIKEV